MKQAGSCMPSGEWLRLRTRVCVKPVRMWIILLAIFAGVVPAAAFSQTEPSADKARQQALALERQGQVQEAVAAWQSFVKLAPSNPEGYAHLGLLEAHQERYNEAIPLYRKALALSPGMPGLRMDLGLALFKSGDLREASVEFHQLLKSEPGSSPEALRLETLIGLADYGDGQYAAAIPYLKDATAHDPSNLPFRLLLAHSCLWSRQYDCVLDVYHQILTLNADSAEADMLAGEAYDEMKNDLAAMQQFRAAVHADPKLPNVHFGLGYLLWRHMEYGEAADQFKAELANNPDHAQALTYLADSEIRMGHPELAQPLLMRAIARNPGIALAHLDLGDLYANEGQKEKALHELQEAERLDPSNVDVHWRLARFYQSEGKKEEAKAEFEKTRQMKQAANASIFSKLKQAQELGDPDQTRDAAPAGK